MKIDMHCHVSGGSLDAIVSLRTTIKVLRSKGFNGMLLTDHNSYKGYDESLNSADFKVFLGIEYDTCDAGHIIIILPNNKRCDLRFEKRGMTLEMVSNIVHSSGGVLGLAHPYAHGRFGVAYHTLKRKRSMSKMVSYVDFIEIFNGTTPKICNIRANKLAKDCNMVGTAGSDSHRKSTTGLCGTIFSREIKNNNDLIEAILSNKIVGIEEGYSKLSNSTLFRLVFNICEWLYSWYHTVSCIKNKAKRKAVNDCEISMENK